MASGTIDAVPHGLRVLMRPTRGQADDDKLVFAGSRVELVCFGGSTALPVGAAQPAEMVVQGVFRDRIRAPEDENTKELARLRGSLRRAENGELVFSAEERDGAPIGLVPTQPEPETNVRFLKFAFHTQQFPNLPNQLLLRIEIEPQYHHLEIAVQLLISGTTEAATTHNDVLDVLVTSRNPPTPAGRIHRFSF